MRNVSQQNYFNFLILLSLFRGISCELGSANEDWKMVPKTGQENHSSDESQVDAVITEGVILDEDNFDDNELKRLFVKTFGLYAEENKNSENKHNKTTKRKHKRESPVEKRNIRLDADLGNIDEKPDKLTVQNIECYQCYADRVKGQNSNCFNGINLPRETCLDKYQCYSEIHHDYVRRGCASASRNRTFVCKCPLCNDKNVDDMSNFEYTSIEDWIYDNNRLKKLTMGIEIMCKVCDTKGISKSIDTICRYGRKADSMVCGASQLCYTNIEEETNYVSRGCISMPVYNSMYFYCNLPLCNNHKFEVEMIRRRSIDSQNWDNDLPARYFMKAKKSCASLPRFSISSAILMIWSLMLAN